MLHNFIIQPVTFSGIGQMSSLWTISAGFLSSPKLHGSGWNVPPAACLPFNQPDPTD
jgi:hypothetical protein